MHATVCRWPVLDQRISAPSCPTRWRWVSTWCGCLTAEQWSSPPRRTRRNRPLKRRFLRVIRRDAAPAGANWCRIAIAAVRACDRTIRRCPDATACPPRLAAAVSVAAAFSLRRWRTAAVASGLDSPFAERRQFIDGTPDRVSARRRTEVSATSPKPRARLPVVRCRYTRSRPSARRTAGIRHRRQPKSPAPPLARLLHVPSANWSATRGRAVSRCALRVH